VSVALIGDDDVARIEMFGGDAEMAEGEGDYVARKTLAVARYGVDGARRKLAQNGQPFDQLGEFLKVLVEETVQAGAVGKRYNLARFAGVEIAQIVKLANEFVALAGNGGGSDGEELVGGLAHGGNHHHGALLRARFDYARDALDGGGRFHRRAAEFHHDHEWMTPWSAAVALPGLSVIAWG
jgi:hypothetical protein